MIANSASAQLYDRITWSKDGNSYYVSKDGAIMEFNLEDLSNTTLVISGTTYSCRGQAAPGY